MAADKAYDCDARIEPITAGDAEAFIPPRANRTEQRRRDHLHPTVIGGACVRLFAFGRYISSYAGVVFERPSTSDRVFARATSL